MSESSSYPWYSVVRGNELAQGDLLMGCTRFVIPPDANSGEKPIVLTRETVDAIVLTQSCDLTVHTDGSCEATDVLLCDGFISKRIFASILSSENGKHGKKFAKDGGPSFTSWTPAGSSGTSGSLHSLIFIRSLR